MPNLFYKGLQAHESAFRHNQADEAVNDLLLGAKVNAYTSLEDAKNNAVDEIATNYGKFLKALKTKEIPLFNRSTVAENTIAQAAQTPKESTPPTRDNLLMPRSSRARTESSDPSSSVIAGLSADLTPEQQKINEAYNLAHNSINVPNLMKQIKATFGGSDSPMTKDFETILNANNWSASSKKSRAGKPVPNIAAIQRVIEGMQQQYFKPIH